MALGNYINKLSGLKDPRDNETSTDFYLLTLILKMIDTGKSAEFDNLKNQALVDGDTQAAAALQDLIKTAISIGSGIQVQYKNPTGSTISKGDIIVYGTNIAVAAQDIRANEVGLVFLEGIFVLPKANEAFIPGQDLYLDNDGKCSTNGSASWVGMCVEAEDVLAATPTCLVKLGY